MYQVLLFKFRRHLCKGICFWAPVPKAGYKESVRIYITNDWYHSCSFFRSHEVLHKEIKFPAPVKDRKSKKLSDT